MATGFVITLHGDRSGWLGEFPVPKSRSPLLWAREQARETGDRLDEPVEAWAHKDHRDGPIRFRTRYVPGVTTV